MAVRRRNRGRPCEKTPRRSHSPWGRSYEGGQHLGREALHLVELIVADESEAEIGRSSGSIAAQRSDHDVGGAEAHRAARVHASAVVRGEELGREALGRAGIVVE